jgi:hypothetical protein
MDSFRQITGYIGIFYNFLILIKTITYLVEKKMVENILEIRVVLSKI